MLNTSQLSSPPQGREGPGGEYKSDMEMFQAAGSVGEQQVGRWRAGHWRLDDIYFFNSQIGGLTFTFKK